MIVGRLLGVAEDRLKAVNENKLEDRLQVVYDAEDMFLRMDSAEDRFLLVRVSSP